MLIAKILCWGALGLIAYTYIGFPLLLLIRGLLVRRSIKKATITPKISLIIVAHNELATIGAKLANIVTLAYPPDKLEIIIASDGSDDGMNELVAHHPDQRIRLLALPRQGKIPALNHAVTQATGEILVFSDANSMYKTDALQMLIAPFADPTVGAVGGNQCYVPDATGNMVGLGERFYWNFDRTLKSMQSKAGNMISATGAIHAIRRELFRPVPLGVGDDFVISTRVIEQGYRLVFEPKAIAYETIAPTDKAEFNRKVRVIVRGLRGLWAVKALFNPLRYGFYAIQITSHKLLRWSVGLLLIVLFIASLSLYGSGAAYRLFAQAQLIFYGFALIAWGLRNTALAYWKSFKLLALPFYFCLANYAALCAWQQVINGRRVDIWDSKRTASDGTRQEEHLGINQIGTTG